MSATFIRKYGKLLYSATVNDDGSLTYLFENEFVTISMNTISLRMRCQSHYKSMDDIRRLLEVDTLEERVYDMSRIHEWVSLLKPMSININGYREMMNEIGSAPFESAEDQYAYYHYFILCSPERLLVKLRDYLWTKDIMNNELFCMLLDEICIRLRELAHEVHITYYYWKNERELFI